MVIDMSEGLRVEESKVQATLVRNINYILSYCENLHKEEYLKDLLINIYKNIENKQEKTIDLKSKLIDKCVNEIENIENKELVIKNYNRALDMLSEQMYSDKIQESLKETIEEISTPNSSF